MLTANVNGCVANVNLAIAGGAANQTTVRFFNRSLPGRVKIERQSLIQGSLGLREPSTSRVVWTTDLAQNFVQGHHVVVEDRTGGRGPPAVKPAAPQLSGNVRVITPPGRPPGS